MNKFLPALFLIAPAMTMAITSAASAQPVPNPIAIFAGLDKITGTITTFEINIGETKRFGSLNVTPRVCNTRPITQEPKTTSFIEVDENLLDGTLKRIFTGWMLAQSPGLNAVEHPVYDIWLTGCRTPSTAKSTAKPDQPTTPPVDEDKKPEMAN